MAKARMKKSLERNPHVATPLDQFLEDEGLYEEVVALAAKKKIARQLKQRMEREDITVSGLAKQLGTSRNQVHRILDPQDHNVTLALERAATAVGCRLKLDLVKP
jgi:hypothetical protein